MDEEELSFGEVEWVDQCLVWAYATKSKPQDGVDEVAFPKGQLEWSKPGIHFDNSAMAMLALLQVDFKEITSFSQHSRWQRSKVGWKLWRRPLIPARSGSNLLATLTNLLIGIL